MIIAIDFDGTLVQDKYPDIGEANRLIVDIVKAHQEKGDKIILWTCRDGESLSEAIHWCKSMGIELAAVNTNLPENQEKYGGDTRKVFADVYYDDKAINVHNGKLVYAPLIDKFFSVI